jgi:hypothetical protein
MRWRGFFCAAWAVPLVATLAGCGSSESNQVLPPPASPVQINTRDSGPTSVVNDDVFIVPVKGTSLHRTLIFLNDNAAPLQIVDANSTFQGRKPGQPITSTLVDHKIRIQVRASKPVVAASARLLYFDTFNAQLQSQPIVWQKDVQPGAQQELQWTGKLDQGRFASLLTIALYFDQIRMADGSLWVPDTREVTSQLRSLHIEAKEIP